LAQHGNFKIMMIFLNLLIKIIVYSLTETDILQRKKSSYYPVEVVNVIITYHFIQDLPMIISSHKPQNKNFKKEKSR